MSPDPGAGYVPDLSTGLRSVRHVWESSSAPSPYLDVPVTDLPPEGGTYSSHVCTRCSHPPAKIKADGTGEARLTKAELIQFFLLRI